jgi:ribosomal protein L9
MEAATTSKAKKSETYADVFSKIANDNGLTFVMKANDKGVLYEKIDPTHIANHIKTVYGVDVAEQFFKMKKKITQTGEYIIPFEYNGMEKDINITIKKESENAQAKEETAVA